MAVLRTAVREGLIGRDRDRSTNRIGLGRIGKSRSPASRVIMHSRSRYPKNWKVLATEIKERSGWKCQKCGLQCLRPGEDTRGLSRSERSARTLGVHHFDRTPENNEPSNLIAVCAACHLGYHAGGRSNVSIGQLSLQWD